MDDPVRRRVFVGATAGGLLVGALGKTGASTQAATTDLEVSIAETDTVPAGEYLRVQTELTNTTGADIRTGLELFVGDDEERIERRELTVPAGETETVRQGFYTYPVSDDQTFPVRVETDFRADETLVGVTGASALPDSSPDSDLTVEPGTEVFFEAGAVVPGERQQTIWWLDGNQESGGVGGPWEAAYFGEVGAAYWTYTFEEGGNREVAAAVLTDEGTYVATWDIEVTAGGNSSPTIDGRQPDIDTLALARGESYEVSITATDPDGDLDRVVWWLTQADTILESDELDGGTDTATLSTDSFCHTCLVVPWVIAADGTASTSFDPGWELLEAEDSEGVSVDIRSTNAPVEAGDTLEVIVDVTNDGSEATEQTLELEVGHDPEVVDTQLIALEGGESGAATLSFETYPVTQPQSFPVRVIGPDDDDEVTVDVET